MLDIVNFNLTAEENDEHLGNHKEIVLILVFLPYSLPSLIPLVKQRLKSLMLRTDVVIKENLYLLWVWEI